MAITFQEAKPVETGDPITSTERNYLAQAFNDHIVSGVGDSAWRIFFAFYSLFRNMRTPDESPESLTYPSEAEFFQFYQCATNRDHAYPTSPPNTVGGAYWYQPLCKYVFGDSVNQSEQEQSARITLAAGGYDDTAAILWDAAKTQRGWRAPDQTADAPAYSLAARWLGVTNVIWDPLNKPNGWDEGYGAWLETPADGSPKNDPAISKSVGYMLRRALHAFDREFRGATTQRADPEYDLWEAFDMREFLTRQYYLAPAKAEDGVYQAIYPKWETDTVAPGPVGAPQTIETGYVASHWHARYTGTITDDIVVKLTWTGGSQQITLTDAQASDTQALNDTALSNMTVEIVSGEGEDGTLTVESTQIEEYKAKIEDLMVVLRMAGTRGDMPNDGEGIDELRANDIYESYKTSGSIVNYHGLDGIPLNDMYLSQNAVWGAAVEMSKWVRALWRGHFVAMERKEGKSSIWFHRHPVGMPNSSDIDPWQGVESRDPDTVRDDLNDKDYGRPGNHWVMDFQFAPYSHSEASFYKPSIYADRYPLQERCLFGDVVMTSSPLYEPLYEHVTLGKAHGGTYALKPEGPSVMRYAPARSDGGGTVLLNYRDCGGDPDCEADNDRFSKSCRIYEPPLEIEDIVFWDEEPLDLNGEEAEIFVLVDEHDNTLSTEDVPAQVKVAFKERPQHHESAPAEFTWKHWDWSEEDLHAEDYQTVEGALRRYMVHDYWGTNWPMITGDHALDSSVETALSPIWQAIYPLTFMVSLVPEVPEDGNDDQETTDAPFVHDWMFQAETYLRAMCEGYIDLSRTSDSYCTDQVKRVYEFRYENLMEQASDDEHRHVPMMASKTTSVVSADEIREDKPWAAGPLPTCYADSEVFNLLANGINLLTVARIPFAPTLECREETGTSPSGWDVSPIIPESDEGTQYCSSGTATAARFKDVEGPEPTDWEETTPWGSCKSLSATANYSVAIRAASLDDKCCDNPTTGFIDAYCVETTATRFEWRIANRDELDLKLPPELKAHIDEKKLAVFTTVEKEETYDEFVAVDTPEEASECEGGSLPGREGLWCMADPQYVETCYDLVPREIDHGSSCDLVSEGYYVPSSPDDHDLWACWSGGFVAGAGGANVYSTLVYFDDFPTVFVNIDLTPYERDPGEGAT